MKKSLNIIITLLFLLVMSGQQARAAATEWKFDTVHSSFHFSVRHVYSTVRGFFEDFSGSFLFDADNLKESRIIFKIKTKSINTNNPKRDNHLRSADFFTIDKYPLISFESSAIDHIIGNQYAVSGKATIKDVTRDLVLPMTFFGVKENPLDPKQLVAGFESQLVLNRLDYHVGDGKFYKMGAIGKDVAITISLEMLRKK